MAADEIASTTRSSACGWGRLVGDEVDVTTTPDTLSGLTPAERTAAALTLLARSQADLAEPVREALAAAVRRDQSRADLYAAAAECARSRWAGGAAMLLAAAASLGGLAVVGVSVADVASLVAVVGPLLPGVDCPPAVCE